MEQGSPEYSLGNDALRVVKVSLSEAVKWGKPTSTVICTWYALNPHWTNEWKSLRSEHGIIFSIFQESNIKNK